MTLTVPETDLIYIESLRECCDYVYDGDAMKHEPPPGVVFVHADNIQRFFRHCRRHPYIVVSGASDFSLFYQADHHPNTDLRRLANYLKWRDAAQVRDRYAAMTVGPACDPQSCDAWDRYSLKTFCWTKATFPTIPANIKHWFIANTNINDDPRVEWIPFGLGSDKGSPHAEDKGKRGLLYANFELHTDERAALLPYCASHPWITTIDRANLHIERYWQDIAEHYFVMCPAGNGLDCYRTYETLYLGSIPVMRRTPFAENFVRHGLPVLLVDSLFEMSPGLLENALKKMDGETFCMEALKLSYWKQRIEDARKLLEGCR
jgi:hypothetical protein